MTALARCVRTMILPLWFAALLAGCTKGHVSAPALRPPRPESLVQLAGLDGTLHEGVKVDRGSPFRWQVPALDERHLRFSWGVPGGGEANLTLLVSAGSGRTTRVISRTSEVNASASTVFHEDLEISLGSPGVVEITADREIVVSDLRLVEPSDENQSVLLMVWDTTRRDSIGLYGSELPTTPNLDELFEGGFVAKRAYAPASWTIPSVTGLMTGRVPAVHEDTSGAPLGTEDARTLAEDFRDAGWSTAAFFANPTLNVKNGFDRGFTAFYTPPYEIRSLFIPGARMMKRVDGWLAAHRGEKTFLYMHFIDPHDPYNPPDRAPGTTPFDVGYRGSFRGFENHYMLTFERIPEPADTRHLQALYRDDIRYVDEVFGQWWDGLPEPFRERTTVVLTADHGEEFLDHGGWKHGPSLYDEVVAVPLMIRAGKGVALPQVPDDRIVSLLDLSPTLTKLFDVPSPGPHDGLDIFDPAARRDALPPITMLTGGAARAVVVTPTSKLHFFDATGSRGIPDAVKDPQGERVARHLPTFLPPRARYAIAEDPREKRALAWTADDVRLHWRDIESAIRHTREGLELRFIGGEGMRDQTVVVRYENARSVEPFAMDADDRVERKGRELRLTLQLDPGDVDGLLLPGETGMVTISSPTCSSVSAAAISAVPAGGTTVLKPEAVTESIPRITAEGKCLSIFAWRGGVTAARRSEQEESEEKRKLRALGYVH